MPKQWIHQTDLFRPYADPDDHWDLACVFALARAGKAELRGVLIDYPPDWAIAKGLDPDLAAVAQMNHFHGLAAPVIVGSSIPIQTKTDTQKTAAQADRCGVEFILRTLRDAAEPVVIHIVGSCRDVALAGNDAPELFREKCAGIYLNAGSGELSHPPGKVIEYNVRVNPAAYSAIFQIPCPIYWAPCWGETINSTRVEEWGTFWCFRQGDVWEALPAELQNYFAYALGRFCRSDWLSFLRQGGEVRDGISQSQGILAEHSPEDRKMWSTAGFLHAAGYTVTTAGQLAPLSDAADPVFEFIGIDVDCDDQGVTHWRKTTAASNRWIFHIRDLSAYPQAMKNAMRILLSKGI